MATSTAAQTSDLPPLIIVQGFLSPASDWIWGNFQDHFSEGEQAFRSQLSDCSNKTRRIIFAPLGPCSSLHDRACELFYALKGGRIDYGKEHSKQHRHSRFGRYYPSCSALYPEFDANHPAHFLGHSLGGTTLSKLQQLLREGFFDHILNRDEEKNEEERSPSGNEAAILSITSISSPFHGTPLVYLLGSQPLTYPSVRFFSIGNFLAKAVHVLAFVDGFAPTSISNATRKVLDVYSDAWPFAQADPMREGLEELADLVEGKDEKGGHLSNRTFLKMLRGGRLLLQQLWRSDWAEERDCAPWECTLWERERDSESNGWRCQLGEEGYQSESGKKVKTWYRSYSAFMTLPSDEKASPTQIESNWHKVSIKHSPIHLLLSPLAFTSNLIGSYSYHKLDPLPTFLRDFMDSSINSSSTLSQASEALRRNEGRKLKKWEETDSAYHSNSTSPSILSPPRSQSPSRKSSLRSRHSGINTPDLESMEKATTTASTSPSSPSLSYSSSTSTSETATSSSTTFEIPSLLESWYANDGVVPLASQFHPGACNPDTCSHSLGLPLSKLGSVSSEAPASTPTNRSQSTSVLQRASQSILKLLPNALNFSVPFTTAASTPTQTFTPTQKLPPKPNHWHVIHLPETSHTSLAPVWNGSEKQLLFWVGFGAYIASVDEASGRVGT